jgi:hypothetical protein
VTNPPDLRRLEAPDATISYRVSGAGPDGDPEMDSLPTEV